MLFQKGSSVKLLDAATGTTTGSTHSPIQNERTYQVQHSTTAGAGAATVVIQVSDVDAPAVAGDWIDFATFTLTLSTSLATEGVTMDAPWRHVRGKVTAISGTGASITLWMGC